MIRICKPFRSATKASITQGFHPSHQANDFAGSYGEDLCAPFNATVANVVESVEDQTIDANKDDLARGYGIRLISTDDPNYSITYWHTLPLFSVAKGDIVLQGQPIAEMGNSGFVVSGGEIVPIDLRTVPPYKGTHVHISFGRIKPDGNYEALDYSQFIDWLIPINYDVVTFLGLIWKNFLRVLQK